MKLEVHTLFLLVNTVTHDTEVRRLFLRRSEDGERKQEAAISHTVPEKASTEPHTGRGPGGKRKEEGPPGCCKLVECQDAKRTRTKGVNSAPWERKPRTRENAPIQVRDEKRGWLCSEQACWAAPHEHLLI